MINLEMYYTLACPNCKAFEHLLKSVLPIFEGKLNLKKYLPMGEDIPFFVM